MCEDRRTWGISYPRNARRWGWSMMRWNGLVGLVLIALVVGCAPAQGPTTGTPAELPGPAQSRTLVVAHRHDPPTLAPKVSASNAANSARLFNAALTLT